nr:minichromosome maintenance component complex 2-like protein [Cryptomonas sp.]
MQLGEWLNITFNQSIVKCRFLYFLFSIFDTKNKSYYFERIKNICLTGKKNLTISFQHMVIKDPILAIWLTDEPEKVLRIFQETMCELIRDVFPEYFSNNSSIHIQISDLPICNTISNLTGLINNTLVKVKGIVISRTNVYSTLSFFRLTCLKCLELQKPIFSTKENRKNISFSCFNCKANGPFQVCNYYSLFSNFQKIGIREINFTNKHFDKFYSKEIILRDNLIDKVKPGEEIEVTGIVKYSIESNVKYPTKIPVFSLLIDANFVEKSRSCHEKLFFDSWEKIFISKVHKDRKIVDFLINSFSPTLVIDKNIRLALILSLFGGKSISSTSKLKIKENINVLIIGQIGTGKTQLLESIQRFLPKSVYITGQGVSLKGLTACLKFDNLIEDWIVEGGALVIADKGYCVIDQIDKLGSLERKYISEAIAHKKIYTVRGNVVNHLNTRCSIIASADLSHDSIYSQISNLSFSEKSIWHEDFISLFDIICVTRDITDSTKDKTIGTSLLRSHMLSHPKKIRINKTNVENSSTSFFRFTGLNNQRLIQKLVSKYITYSRCYIEPKLSQIDQNLISNFYISIRRQIYITGGIQMTLKHLESLLRLIESSARIYLRDSANLLDVCNAMNVMLKSIIELQPTITKNIIKLKFKSFLNQN